MTVGELETTLRRWEAAVYECEGAGNDSDEAQQELNDSRAALLTLLKKALTTVENEIIKPYEDFATIEHRDTCELLRGYPMCLCAAWCRI